jgi:hypothetical protein
VPVIKANLGIVTQINVFTVPQGGQQALIEFLAEASKFASSVPGWISASIHRSRDGTRVVNCAQSESLEAAERITCRLRDAGWLDRNSALGQAHPGLYDVVFTPEGQRALLTIRFGLVNRDRTGSSIGRATARGATRAIAPSWPNQPCIGVPPGHPSGSERRPNRFESHLHIESSGFWESDRQRDAHVAARSTFLHVFDPASQCR